MLRSRRSTEWAGLDDGSASIEFIAAGLLLLVPLVYLVLALSSIQNAAFGVEGAVRQASRVFVQADSLEAAEDAAARAIEVVLADYGIGAGDAAVAVTCRPDPEDCLARRGFVTVTLSTTVALPLAPPALGVELPAGFTLTATSTEQVSRFRGSG
jgi:hypothetical protein